MPDSRQLLAFLGQAVIKRALALIGAAVVALWILGALGLGDFRLCFAAVGKCERPNAKAHLTL
jgi:hypothetical protein